MKDVQVERILEEVKRGLTVLRQSRRLSGADEVATADMIEGLETVLVHVQAQPEHRVNRVVVIVEGGVIRDVFADRPGDVEIIRADYDADSEDALIVNDAPADLFENLDTNVWNEINAARTDAPAGLQHR